VRKACLVCLQTWFVNFYPERPDLVAELQSLAADLHGHLEVPELTWKYNWVKSVFGWKAGKAVEERLQGWKGPLARRWDKTLSRFES
jgi:hypothetical protein